MKVPVSVGSVIGEKYLIERILGSGGMSVVAQARHLDLEQEVAIKFLSATLDRAECAERFRREARAAARIRSEHVARILDFGTLDDETPFMVMEYLEGNDLAEELERRRTLPVEELVDYVLQAIEALSEAHANGIVHRDIKPQNLFLARLPDLSRSIKVLDFGISRSLAGGSTSELSLTKTAAFIGSPLYMSPEQMRAPRKVDHRSDIWSLGVMLYEGVSGRLPYVADTIPALCSMVLNDEPPALSSLCRVPPDFEAVVARCLEKDPARRFADLAELSRALAPFATGSNARVARVARILDLARARTPGRGTLAGISPSAPRIELGSSELSSVRRQSRRERMRPATPERRLLDGNRRTVSAWGKTDATIADGKRRPWTVAASVLGTALIAASVLGRGPTPDPGAPDAALLERRLASAAEPVAAAAEPEAAAAEPEHAVERPRVLGSGSLPVLTQSQQSVEERGVAPPAADSATPSKLPARAQWIAPITAAAPALPAASAPALPVATVRHIDPWDPSNFGGRQ